MNYSKGIKKDAVGKRILLSWVIVALIFSFIGCSIGLLIAFNSIKPKEETIEPEIQTEVLIFGAPEESSIVQNKLNFTLKDADFIPLDVPMDRELQELVFYLAKGYNIDFTFAMAVIQQESAYQTDAVSTDGDSGLFQINEINLPYLENELGEINLIDPLDNIRSGMFILRNLFEKYETPDKVLMAYNLGENGASQLWENGVFEINYSKSVLSIQNELIAEMKGA